MIRVIVLFYLFLITETNGKDLFEKEQDMLGKNLKVLRQDFNELMGNVEDFATDVLRQIADAGKLMQNAYVEEDYNWQDDKANTIVKTPPKPIPTTTEHLLNSKNPFIKHQKQIKERRKRAISPMYDNRQMNLNNQNEFLESQQKEIENKQPVCTKTNEEIVAEKQKLDQLKAEVQKLNELISLLKDQQTMMKKIGPENNVEVNALESSFLYKTIKMLEDERKNKQSSDSQINQELNRIKLNLQKTEDTLNKTQEILLSDRDREEVLENEIKRHNTDLKFLKVMMENLYDKTYSNKQKRLEPKIIKADDYEDNTTNTILGAMHMNRNPLESLQDQLEVTLRDNQQNTEKFLRHLAEEQDNIRRQLYFQNTRNGGRFQEGFMNNQRRSAPERLKKSQITRDSEHTDENQNTNMHRLLTMLSKQDNPSDVHQIPETNEQIKTNGSEFGRASSKSDDIDFKLKVIEILNKEGKSDEEKKEKQLQEGLLKLLKPEKKTTDSDEDALLALMTLLPKKTSSQSSLTKLIEALRPQGKSDDFEVDEELRQLQKAINSLKPKQDNFDLGNNRPAKDDSQNFQAMLTQLVAQNNGNPSVNFAAMTPQLLNQYLATSSSAQSQNNGFNYRPSPFESTSASSTSTAPNLYNGGPNFNAGGYNPVNNGYYPGNGFNGLQGGNPYASNYGTGFNLAPYGNGLGNYRGGYQSGNTGPIYDSPSGYSGGAGIFNGGYGTGTGAGYGVGTGSAPAYGSADYGSTFFLSNPAAGAGYTDNNYGPKSYAGPNHDQSYGNSQTSDQYKYNMINDLTQQVQNLEGVIKGLNQGGSYYNGNSYDDKASIIRLDRRIQELKGVINGLNKPGYPQQGPYEQSQYRQNQPPQNAPPQPSTSSQASQKPNYAPQPLPSTPQHSYRPPPPAAQTSSSTAAASTAPPYQQPKHSTMEDRNMNLLRNIMFNEDKRRKRQIGPGQNKQFGFGEDPLTKLAEQFKKFFDENLGLNAQQQQRSSNELPQERSSALDGLQKKLDSLKIQLGSHNPYLSDVYSNVAPAYGLEDNFKKSFPLQTFENKKVDFLSETIVKILDIGLKLLPSIFSKLFGKLVVGVGDSYGDYYSPLQNLLQNLGPLGYFPLILVKILESIGQIFKYLKKNHFFKGFLLPAGVLGLVAGAILFLIYFLQQDEPYGYISYEGDKGYYPQYEHKSYDNHYRTTTNPELDRPFENHYRSTTNPELDRPIENYRSIPNTDPKLDNRPNYRAMEPTNNNYFNEKFNSNDNGKFIGHNNVYSRGYYLDNR